ncbi:hypothetical protein [Candidatus Harpocratesius sp.]
MFENERKESEAFFNYFLDKFNEEVGLLLAFYDDDEFEIDLIVGMDTETIYGLNILQYISSEKGYEEFGNQDDENSDHVEKDDDEEYNSDEEKEDDEEEDDSDEDEDDEEDEGNDVIEEIQYMFVKMEISPSNLEGKPYFQIDLAETSKEQEEKQSAEDNDNLNSIPQFEENALRLIIYAKPTNGFEDEDITDLPGENVRLTGAVMIKGNDKESLVVFCEDPSIG